MRASNAPVSGPPTRRLVQPWVLAVLVATALPGCGGEPGGAEAPTAVSDAAPARLESADPLRPPELADEFALKDPLEDAEWETEAFQESVVPMLTRFASLAAGGGHQDGGVEPRAVEKFLTEDFSCTPLAPRSVRQVAETPAVRVARASEAPEVRVEGAAGLAEELTLLTAKLADSPDAEVEYKVVGVQREGPERVHTKVRLQSRGSGPRQWRAVWICSWSDTLRYGPRLAGIEVQSYEEVVRADADTPFFEDRTAAVLGANPSYAQVLVPGLRHWLGRLDMSLGNDSFGHHGLALGDVNGDGLDDVYLCTNGGLPNLLYVQEPDGTASDRSAESGLDFLDRSRSALLVDLDGDGDEDAAVATEDLLLLENDGSGVFELRGRVQGRDLLYSMAAADYDEDGDLDLYVCRYITNDLHVPDPYHDARNGPPNWMLRNDGDWTFTDVTSETGLDHNNDRFSFAAAWGDYDEDGGLDLYVANDYGRNNLYRNEGGRFRDVARDAGVEDVSAGMSASWADVDGDGLLDLYVSNMFSSAGNRIAYQDRFQAGTDQVTRGLFQRHARGNSLYANAGDGTFRDVSVERDVTYGRWAWGSCFCDLDNDGLEDVLVANGFVTNEIADDL